VLFVDNIGVSGMTRAARIARRSGIPVVADFDSAHDPQFFELLPLADHLIISATFAKTLTGEAAPAKAATKLCLGSRQVVVVTSGAKGCWYLAAGGTAPKHQAAFKVKAVDTTGCGDVFHGAYAAGLAWGMELAERIRFAAAAAALKATEPGGQAGIPLRAVVEKFLL